MKVAPRSQRIVQAFLSGVLTGLTSVGYTEEAVKVMQGELMKYNKNGSLYGNINTLTKCDER